MAEYICKPDLEEHVMVRQEEIIRCRECKHCESIVFKTLDMNEDIARRCKINFTIDEEPLEVQGHDFCAWAERDA